MKTRIILAVFLVTLFAVPFYSAYSADFEFEDIDEEHENFDAIKFLSEAGIIDGYLDEETGERSYKPENEINRAEFLKILLKDSGKQADLSSKCFPDVPTDVWYALYVCAAKEAGLVDGYEDGKFRPETTISEAEALKIVGKAFEWQVDELEAGEQWYEPYLNYAKNADLIESDDVSAFLNRGGMAELFFRSLEVLYFDIEAFDKDLVDDLFAVLDEQGSIVEGTVDYGGEEVNVDIGLGDGSDESVDADSGDEAGGVSELKIYIPSSSPASDENNFDIEAEVYGMSREKLSGRSLSAVITTGIDFYKNLSMTESGTGHYKVSFGSVLAGDYNLIVSDLESGAESETQFTITPLSLSSADIIDTVSPPVNGGVDRGYIKVVGRDVYGNILPYSSSNNLSAVTSLGTVVDVSHDEYGVFTMWVAADELGMANVSIINKANDAVFSVSTEIPFLAVQLDPPKGIDMKNTSQIDIPVYIYFPESLGDLYSYNLTLVYCTQTLAFSSVEDPDSSDDFDLPSVEVDKENGLIYLSQTRKEVGVSAKEAVEIASLKMDVIGIGTGSIYVSDGTLTNTDGEEGFLDGVIDGIAKWWYNIKDTKDLCVDIFTVPGSNITQQKINQDIAWANLIFSKIAQSCNCDYYLNFSVHSVTDLDAAKWGGVDTNGDNDLDVAELNGLMASYPPTGSCIPVYYPPATDGGDLGWTWSGGGMPMGVAVDNNKDPDNRTLAHEIAHYLSHREVEDPGNPPDSTSQGADTAGNLMNYNNTGDDLTEDQCELIEKYLK